MISFVVLVTVIAAVSTADAASIKPDTSLRFQPQKPEFCNKLDCPSFTVLKETKEYELRNYKQVKWVSTSLKGMDYSEALRTMFMKLYQYISGANTAGRKIAMTTPVLIRIIPGQGPTCENDFTMSFFVPEPNAPAPTNKDVKFSTTTDLKVYVRSFGGFAFSFDKVYKQAVALKETLDKEKSSYEISHYFYAGYNSPFQPFNRHNEVWFIAK